jgi:hypothetical protein
MRVLKSFAALAFALILSAAAPATEEPALVGFWYGIGEPDDVSVSYIDAYHADGTYDAAFRKCEHGEAVWSQTAHGIWTLKDGVLKMISDMVDGKPAVYDHSYTIEHIDGSEFHARLHEPDFLFIEKRIDTFEFPPCYLGA